MFKQISCAVLLCIIICLHTIPISCDPCDTSCQSHSFFLPRDITSNNLLQHNLTLFWWYRAIFYNHSWFTLQASPFYQRSTNGDDIARFFLPCNQCSATVKEDGSGDIGSLWLNLIAAEDKSFDGSFSISPRRTLIGAYINLRFNWKPKIGHYYWSDIAFAAMHSKHELRLCECPSKASGVACGVASICQALNQEDWKFGNFCPETQTAGGIDNIEFKIGYDWYFLGTDRNDHISPYFTVTAPTGKGSEADCIFEPVLGGEAIGVGFGVIADYTVYINDKRELAILTDFKYLYGLPSCERRSFDLCKNGDWSRYLQVVCCDARSDSLPGINLFTQEVKAKLRSRIDWWVGLHYHHCNWDVEVGYDLWWQQKESLELCTFPCGFGIYDMVGDCNINPVSASCAQICQSIENNMPPSDDTFIELSACDLNLDSGTMPRALTNSIYAALGYNGDFHALSALIGAGTSYEFSVDRNALSNWTVWFKMGLGY